MMEEGGGETVSQSKQCSAERSVEPTTPDLRSQSASNNHGGDVVSLTCRSGSEQSVRSPVTIQSNHTHTDEEESEYDETGLNGRTPHGGTSSTNDTDTSTANLPIVIFGPPGAGKWTLQHRLAQDFPKVVVCQLTHPSTYDVSGESRPAKKIPYETYHKMHPNRFFGYDTQRAVERAEVKRIQKMNCIPLLDVTNEGAKSIMKEKLQCKWVYVSPPDEAELQARNMMARLMKAQLRNKIGGTRIADTEGEVMQAQEVSEMINTLYSRKNILHIVNEDLDVAYEQLKAFVLQDNYIPPVGTSLPEENILNRVTMVVESTKNFGFIQRIRSEQMDLGVPVSHTTRPRKEHEQDGVDYHFVSDDRFRSLALNQEFLEFAVVGQYFFGITKAELTRLADYPRVLIAVNVIGAVSIKKVQFGTRFILIHPAPDELRENSELEVLRDDMNALSEVPFFFDLVLEVTAQNQEECYERFKDAIMKGHCTTEGDAISEAVVYQVLRNRTGKCLKACHAMKSDHFPSGKVPIFEDIPGVPNYRQVDVQCPNFHTFHGMAQPTKEGIEVILNRILGGDKKKKVLIVNLREEKVMYINGKPFCLKNLRDIFHNTILFTSVSREILETREDQLRVDILNEASKSGMRRFLVHDEQAPHSSQFAACGSVFAYYEAEVDRRSVKTVKTVMYELQKQHGYNIEYLRLPVADEKAPRDEDFDTLKEALWKLHAESPSSPILFNCQLGRGRTTTALLLALLTLNPPIHTLSEAHDRNVTTALDTLDSVLTYCASLADATDPTYTLHHLHFIIGKCAHIQNLYDCIAESVRKFKNCVDEHKKTILWNKVENYAKRYYYLAMAAVYISCKRGDTRMTNFATWMDDNNAWLSFMDTEVPLLESRCGRTRKPDDQIEEASGTFRKREHVSGYYVEPNPPFDGPIRIVVAMKKASGLCKRFGIPITELDGKVVVFQVESWEHPTYGHFVKKILKFTNLFVDDQESSVHKINSPQKIESTPKVLPMSPLHTFEGDFSNSNGDSRVFQRQVSSDENVSPSLSTMVESSRRLPVSPLRLSEIGFPSSRELRDSFGNIKTTVDDIFRLNPSFSKNMLVCKSDNQLFLIQEDSLMALCTAYVFATVSQGIIAFLQNSVIWFAEGGRIEKTINFDKMTFVHSLFGLQDSSKLMKVVLDNEFLRHLYGDVGGVKCEIFHKGISVLSNKPVLNNLPGKFDGDESLKRLKRLLATDVTDMVIETGLQHSPPELVNIVLRSQLAEKDKTIEKLKKQLSHYEQLL
eukprot:TRINITY_DN796_c0_g4_i1.p1 TRINITY_DN796_c0_g4~~TRINITY_DN796_c0_g4_i1.p1  ORF type:complete len:1271 (+),score=231.29 TRINITY_DN796_c0_g4_i1:69-3881(+)